MHYQKTVEQTSSKQRPTQLMTKSNKFKQLADDHFDEHAAGGLLATGPRKSPKETQNIPSVCKLPGKSHQSKAPTVENPEPSQTQESARSKVIYDAHVHEYNPSIDQIALRKRKPYNQKTVHIPQTGEGSIELFKKEFPAVVEGMGKLLNSAFKSSAAVQLSKQEAVISKPVEPKPSVDELDGLILPVVKRRGAGAQKKAQRSISESAESNSAGSVSGMSQNQENHPDRNLMPLMRSLFEGKDMTIDMIETLTLQEKYILTSLLSRKFGVTMNPVGSSGQIVHSINAHKDHCKTKRLEENYKLVFKRGLKFLLRKFKKTHKIKGKKNELERRFYLHYFEEAFKKGDKKEDPFETSKSGGFKVHGLFNPKTINSKYVSNIMRSEIFKQDFDEFLEKSLLEDYNRTREFKIKKVVDKCYELYHNNDETGFFEVQKYVEENPKCKLPWSNQELSTARQTVRFLLSNKINKMNEELQEKRQQQGASTTVATTAKDSSI